MDFKKITPLGYWTVTIHCEEPTSPTVDLAEAIRELDALTGLLREAMTLTTEIRWDLLRAIEARKAVFGQ